MTAIVDWLEDLKVIQNEDREVYGFGVRQGIIYFINILTLLVIAIAYDNVFAMGVFTIFYFCLRQYAGGYHAESEMGCYITSTLMMLIIATFMSRYQLDGDMAAVVLIIAAALIWLLGPVEDHHKPLDNDEVKVYGKRMKQVILGELICILIAGLLGWNRLVDAATLAVFTAGVVVVLGWMKNLGRAII